MKIVAQNLIIEDYIDALKRGDIVINREYQRSNQVWPDMAKSYLMETIIRDFPIPKLFLRRWKGVVMWLSKNGVQPV